MRRGRYAPRELGPAGRQLWKQVTSRHPDLAIGESVLLLEAARTADVIEKLHADAMRPGASRRNLVELRGQRRTLADLIAQLGI